MWHLNLKPPGLLAVSVWEITPHQSWTIGLLTIISAFSRKMSRAMPSANCPSPSINVVTENATA